MPKKTNTLGYSLIELMVVLMIIGTLLYLIGPSFVTTHKSLETKQILRKMISDIRVTRLEAIKTAQQQTWHIDLKKRQFWHSVDNKKTEYPESLRVEFTTASQEVITNDQATLRFFPSGSSTGAALKLMSDTQQYQFKVDWLTGQVLLDE